MQVQPIEQIFYSLEIVVSISVIQGEYYFLTSLFLNLGYKIVTIIMGIKLIIQLAQSKGIGNGRCCYCGFVVILIQDCFMAFEAFKRIR